MHWGGADEAHGRVRLVGVRKVEVWTRVQMVLWLGVWGVWVRMVCVRACVRVCMCVDVGGWVWLVCVCVCERECVAERDPVLVLVLVFVRGGRTQGGARGREDLTT